MDNEALMEYRGYPHFAFVQKFEKDFDGEMMRYWIIKNWHLSLYFSIAYLFLISFLMSFMKNRKPMKIGGIIMLWNSGLAIFSICGMLRAIPEMSYVIWNYGFEFSMCNSNANSVSFFWAFAFMFSKAFELLDTVFLALKKRKITFLHVSHHALTLIITWYYAGEAPGGVRWFATLNYSVHAVMYTYFALKAFNVNIPTKVSMCITIAQIMQFIIGVVGGLYAINANIRGRQCTSKMHHAIAFVIFCSLLLYLFIHFFLQRYGYINIQKKNKLS